MRGDISLSKTTPQVVKKQEQPMKNYKIDDIKVALNSSTSVQILVPTLGVDAIASAAALGLSLKQAGKTVSIFCPQTPDANYSKLAGLDLLSPVVTNSDLTVTVDYPLEQIEKVSYNDNGGKLNLVVEIKPGFPAIVNNQISIASQSGSSADLIILLGDPSGLGDKKDSLTKGNLILISPAEVASITTNLKLVDPDAPYSEILTFLIPMLGLELTPDSAKNLLIALRVATQSFAVNVSPESFEAGAIALKASQIALEQAQAAQQANPVAVESKEQPGQNKPNPMGMN